MALADERNRPLLERDLRYAWWNNHCVVDAAIGTFIEYGTKDRRKDRESYAEMWRRWIYDDYHRSYLLPLEKYGLTIPHDLVEEAWKRIVDKRYVHEVAQVLRHRAAGRLLAHRRHDRQGLRVVRGEVPGLVQSSAAGGRTTTGWRTRAATSPSPSRRSVTSTRTGAGHVWCLRLIREDMIVDKVDGQWRTYCSETCHWTDAVAFRGEYEGQADPNMGRLAGFREWETLHHGKDLADIVSDLGYVRDDGKTLVGQPHLRPRRSEEVVDPRRRSRQHVQQPERAAQRDVR